MSEDEKLARLKEFAIKDRFAMEIDLSGATEEELMAHYQRACATDNTLYVSRVERELKGRFNVVIWPSYNQKWTNHP